MVNMMSKSVYERGGFLWLPAGVVITLYPLEPAPVTKGAKLAAEHDKRGVSASNCKAHQRWFCYKG